MLTSDFVKSIYADETLFFKH